MLQIKEITKTYTSKTNPESNVTALKNVSLIFGDSGLVFIVGKSGCGKSTMLNILGGLDTPDCGEMIIDQKSSLSFKKSDFDSYRNTCVGFVFQEYNLIDDFTVEKNISIAISLQGKKASKDTVDECLKKVDMAGCAKRRPNQLSGGQKQRVAIARALIKDPKIILADEPTGALDSETGSQIMKLLKDLSKDKLVIVVSHDLQYAKKYGDRIIKLKDGCVIGDSNPKPEDKKQNNLSLIKSKLGLFDSIKLAIRSLKCKFSKLILTIILSVVAFSTFGVMSAFTNWNRIDAITYTINNSDNKEISLKSINDSTYYSGIFTEAKTKEIKNKYTDVFVKEIVGASRYGDRIGHLSISSRGINNPRLPGVAFSKVYENADVYGYTCFSDDDLKKSGFDLEGRLPLSQNEIAISKIHYDSLKKADGLTTYEGLVISLTTNESSNIDFNVVGVIDNHFDTKKYAKITESDFINDKNLADRLHSDIVNSFTGIVYLNDSAFNSIKESEYSSLTYLDDGVFNEIKINDIYSDLESLYNDYLNKKYEIFCRDSEYYLWNDNHIILQARWFFENGYKESIHAQKYTKTVTDAEGTYEVVYEFNYDIQAWERTSEKPDGTLVIPEKPDLNITKQDFIDKQFVKNNKVELKDLLDNDGYFVELSGNDLILGIDSPSSTIYDQFVHGNQEIEIFSNNKALDQNKISFMFLQYDVETGEMYTGCKLTISNNLRQKIDETNKGYWKLNAVLTNNPSLNRDFVKYCNSIDSEGNRIEIQNVSTNLVGQIDSFMKGIVSTICVCVAFALALFSSLLLMNFLFISVSYSKKEIGILRGLGARNIDVLKIFAEEGLIISLINGVIASVVAIIGCLIINGQFAKALGYNVAILNISPVQPLLILACCLISSLLACALPILKNANKKPIDTINNH